MLNLNFNNILPINKKGIKIKFDNKNNTAYFKICLGSSFLPIILDCPIKDILFAIQNSKFKHFTPKEDYLSEENILLNLNVNPTLASIIPNLSIQPSTISRFQGPKSSKKFHLIKWKPSAISGWGNCNSISVNNKKNPELNNNNQDEINRCYFNLNLAISNAAKFNNLNYFNDFLSAFSDLKKAQNNKNYIISPNKEKKLLSYFVQHVDLLQNNK